MHILYWALMHVHFSKINKLHRIINKWKISIGKKQIFVNEDGNKLIFWELHFSMLLYYILHQMVNYFIIPPYFFLDVTLFYMLWYFKEKVIKSNDFWKIVDIFISFNVKCFSLNMFQSNLQYHSWKTVSPVSCKR